MILDHLKRKNLFEHEEPPGALKNHTKEVQTFVVKEVVAKLASEANRFELPGLVSSVFNLQWHMECLGWAFNLGMEEEASIDATLELYYEWVNGKRKPSTFRDHYQRFTQEIFKHVTQLFALRDPGKDEKRHGELCLRAIRLYEDAMNGGQLKKETLSVLLRCVLGVTDYLLEPRAKELAASPEPSLPPQLSTPILRLLFTLFMQCRIGFGLEWARFKTLCSNWMHHEQLAAQWSATIDALNLRMLSILYGPEEGEDGVVVVNSSNKKIKLIMPENQVAHCWTRMLFIIGNVNDFEGDEVYLTAMRGLFKFVSALASVGSKERAIPMNVNPPNGNTILALVGDWLFEATHRQRNRTPESYYRGRAYAYTMLCNLFSNVSTVPIKDTYANRFYMSMVEGLMRDGNAISAIIQHSRVLMSSYQPGLRILVPSFLLACERILMTKRPGFDIPSSPALLRRATLSTVAGMLFFGQHYSALPLFTWTSPRAETLETYEDARLAIETHGLPRRFEELSDHFQRILQQALATEESQGNIQTIIWLQTALIVGSLGQGELDNKSKSVESMVNFVDQVIPVIKNRVLHTESSTNSYLVAMDSLSTIANLLPRVRASFGPTASKITRSAVLALLTFLETHLNDMSAKDKKETRAQEMIVSAAYHTLTHWCVADQWVLTDPKTLLWMLEVIEMGVSGERLVDTDDASLASVRTTKSSSVAETTRKQGKPVRIAPGLIGSVIVSAAAQHAYRHIIGLAGNYPALPLGAVSANRTEDDVFAELFPGAKKAPPKADNFVRYFAVNRSIVTIIERYDLSPNGPHLSLIMRDAYGRYSWDARLQYYPAAPVAPEDKPIKQLGDPEVSNKWKQRAARRHARSALYSAQEPSRFGSNLGPILRDKQKNTLKAVEQQVARDLRQVEEVIRANVANAMPALPSPVPTKRYGEAVKFQFGRLFLTHLGLLNPMSMDDVVMLDNSAARKAIKNLDFMNERDMLTCGVVRVLPGQRDPLAVLANPSCDALDEFCYSIAWAVPTAAAPGKRLLAAEYGHELAYYAVYDTEIVFRIAPRLMTAVPGQAAVDTEELQARKERFDKDRILIVWSEDRNYQPLKVFTSTKILLQIIIHPLPTGMFQLRTYKLPTAEKMPIPGPVVNNMICGRASLPILVRETAINMHRSLRRTSDLAEFQSKAEKRRVAIDQMITAGSKSDPTPANYYARFFQPTTS